MHFVELEIQDANDIDGFQPVVPLSFLSLFADGESGIVKATILEELLFATLHLHQYLFAIFVLAIHVEHCLAVGLARAKVFRVEISQVFHHLLAMEQAVDEADEQVFVDFGAEQFLETEIGVRIDITVF